MRDTVAFVTEERYKSVRKRAVIEIQILQGVQEKMLFIRLRTIPRLNIAARDIQSSQRNASVQSLLAVQFDQFPYN